MKLQTSRWVLLGLWCLWVGSLWTWGEEYYVSPTGIGNGSGTSVTNAAAFHVADLNQHWLSSTNSNRTNITVFFLPGTYQVKGQNIPTDYDQRLLIWNASNRTVRLKGIVGSDGQLPVLQLSPLDRYSARNYECCVHWPPANGLVIDTLLRTALPEEHAGYLDRVEVENLEFDGNFDGQGALTSAAASGGYKSAAVLLWARTGHLLNLRVRNFGTVGAVPLALADGDPAGTEGFPVSVFTYLETPAQTAIGGDAFPWLVQDVEVSDFRTLHGSYGTMLVACVFFSNLPPSRTIITEFRRCHVHSVDNVTGFGTSGLSTQSSGLIRWEDCVIQHAGFGFNTDTFAVNSLELTNNVFPDVGAMGQLGTPDTGNPSDKNYYIHDNLIRLRGAKTRPFYSDYKITNQNSWAESPDLPLGRPTTNIANGLIFQGIAGPIELINNQFTTWPLTNFIWSIRRI